MPNTRMISPEPEGDAHPEVEPEPEPEPEGYPESNMEPFHPIDSNPEETDVAKTDNEGAFAEPVPDWKVAIPLYGKAWEFHIYFIGSAFALLAVYSLISIIRLRKRRLLSRGYFLALNSMLLLLGVDRAVYLFVDAYNHKSLFPLPVTYLMLGLGFPCLTSAFSILFLALLQSTKTQLVPAKIQKPSYLAFLITVHFLISLISDTLLGFFASTFFLTLICQVTFIIWGLFLSISFMIIFRRLYRSTIRLYRESVRLSLSKRSLSLTTQAPRVAIPRNSWGSAIKLTLLIAFFGVLTALLQLYGIIVVYSPVAGVIPEPWPWWAYQFIFRCVELAMCLIMSYVATQPFRYTKDGQEKKCAICCQCCSKKEEYDMDDQAYWKKYFEAAPVETFLPKSDSLPPKENPQTLGTQTSWHEPGPGPGPNVNDASWYDSNSLQKLLHKGKRFKGLTKTNSNQDLNSEALSKMKVTSQSFSSFGIFYSQESGHVIHNDLVTLQDQKNYNMNANHSSTPALTLLLTEEQVNGTHADKSVSPLSVTAPLLNSETAI